MSEIDPDIYNQLIFDKGTKAIQQMEKESPFFNKGTGIIGDMYVYIYIGRYKSIYLSIQILNTDLTSYIKINSKCIIHPSLNHKTIKCLEENEEKFRDNFFR